MNSGGHMTRIEGFSRNASDLFRIAVGIAGFNASDLMKEITKRQGRRDAIVNMQTVDNAMQVISDRAKLTRII
jgi:hypothetical protein